MFNTELTIDEEVIMNDVLGGRKLSRRDILLNLKNLAENTNESDNKEPIISLFEKIKTTTEHEYVQYRDILISNYNSDEE